MPFSKNSRRRYTPTPIMLRVKIVSSSRTANRRTRPQKKEVQSVGSGQWSKAILKRITIAKNTKKLANHGTKKKLIIYLFLHIHKRRLRLITVSGAPSYLSLTSIKTKTVSAIRSSQSYSAAILSHKRNAVYRDAQVKTANIETVTVASGIL